ncbi:DUF1097 family protein, partial [Escherichia coli]|uniref:DUF1097 family protein n=1 Tax=Escherichia coli TaxID=562 RepID=UPI002105F5E6
GIKLFAITDHGPDMEDAPHHWHFINMRIWPRVVDGVGILRGMNILLSIAITTGILSGIWGWVAVSLGLLSWAGFLGCTAY